MHACMYVQQRTNVIEHALSVAWKNKYLAHHTRTHVLSLSLAIYRQQGVMSTVICTIACMLGAQWPEDGQALP